MKTKIAISLAITVCLILSMSAFSKYKEVNTSNVTESAFERIDLHKGIIKEANFVPDADWPNTIQSGGTGLAEAVVSNGGSAGSSQLSLQSLNGFGVNQLITYEGSDRQYYTAVITKIDGSMISIKPSLETSISSPQKIQNFYADPDHPNMYGYKAIADYSVRNLVNLNKGKHVLFGDSWFDHSPRHFLDRLSSRLPNATIINAAIGGNTTQNLLDRFDKDVANHKPDTIWLMVSTNDYNQLVSKETYSKNIQKLIQKIRDLGARAIVFNSSVGKPIVHDPDGKKYPSPLNTLKDLSHDYYNELENILNN